MLEKTVEAYLVERVRALGGTAYKFTSPARASVPDRIVILPPGRIYFVELKRPGGKLTRGQEREHEHLRRLGADVRMLDSIGAINTFLNEVQAVAADEAPLDEDRIDWIANAHCPGGTAYPVNVKNAIREALREAHAAISPATPEKNEWKDAVDAELVTILSTADTYAGPKEAVKALIDWHVQVALDPAVSAAARSLQGATADERAAFVLLIGYERPETEGCAVDVWDSHRATWSAAIEFARASQAAAPADTREPHADDVAVDEFAIEMKAKMAAARAKGHSGWETCAPADLSRMLREHVEKGGPRDVANFCMMLHHHHGAPIGGSADAGEAVAPVVAALRKLVHLKSLKDGADRCVPGYIEDRIEYQRDKPKAWDDARAALASFDAAQGAQGGKGGKGGDRG
ncbi:VRR-NUC domain-containing protein [Burkholderia gladioli]|uniref:VRR-NUC domain-containing protein n=1 Tax=Burkholderia gladioli TaxID=28095 RepID=UPI001ABBB60F|nr:VRR-NUC domain-containing protein [Burkholderia gladioli]